MENFGQHVLPSNHQESHARAFAAQANMGGQAKGLPERSISIVFIIVTAITPICVVFQSTHDEWTMHFITRTIYSHTTSHGIIFSK